MKGMRIASIPASITYYPGRKSRVVKSFYQFLFGSALNILRAYRDYAPLKFFGNLGVFFFVIGVVCSGIFLGHWIVTDRFSPFKFLGFIGIYCVSLAFLVWVVGLMADMLDRMLGNQEKIIERLKKMQFEEKDGKQDS